MINFHADFVRRLILCDTTVSNRLTEPAEGLEAEVNS